VSWAGYAGLVVMLKTWRRFGHIWVLAILQVAALQQATVLRHDDLPSSNHCSSAGASFSVLHRPVRINQVTCRFEQLALGYDEDDIGSLADDDPDIAGDTAVDEFSDALVILNNPKLAC